jgi:predicted acylesterase/phospholipase RssA
MYPATPDILLCSVGYQRGNLLYYSQTGDIPGVTAWSDFDEYVAATLASTNQPLIMPASILGGQQCFDGGVREIAPLKILSGVEDLTTVVIIANSPEDPALQDTYFKSFLEIGPRSLDLMTTEILNDDIAKQYVPGAEVIVIRPQEALPTTGLEFRPEVMEAMRQTGIRVAQQVLG